MEHTCIYLTPFRQDEFEDDGETLRTKVRVLLGLLKTSKAVVAYTGSFS